MSYEDMKRVVTTFDWSKKARKHFNERLDALHYHDKNCNEYCEVCAKLERWNNEGKESRIHKEPLVV